MPFAVPYRPARRRKMKKGFTLIELLVVVLIIGILSAVALPQYQKSVEKARASEAAINLRALDDAMQLYVLERGEPTLNLEDLSIELSGEKVNTSTIKSKFFTYDIRNLGESGKKYELVATRNDNSNDVMKYYLYYSYSGHFTCVAKKEASKSICAGICGATPTAVAPGNGNDGAFSCRIN